MSVVAQVEESERSDHDSQAGRDEMKVETMVEFKIFFYTFPTPKPAPRESRNLWIVPLSDTEHFLTL